MNRYAPTLFVGLGGSGVAVVRWLKEIAGREAAGQPLVFRGIDFDSANSSSGPPAPLDSGEFQIFSPLEIAECVRTINNNVVLPLTHPQRKAFDLIRQWYPDLEGNTIRYAQAEAAGARQWRVLGRIGFFLNDEAIFKVIASGLSDLEKKGTKAERVVLISSMSGGTGSGILIDVAASIRAKHAEMPVHAVLLLPEFFDYIDFRSKIAANGYAMLWELAELSQRIEFKATYPRLDEINWRTTTAPLTRIYLVGPYVGDRRPFLMPDEAYPSIADILLVLSDAELLGNARSYQANSDGAAVGRDDPYARYVFSSFAAASIRLIRYGEIGDLVSRAMAVEAASREGPYPVFNLLTGLPTAKDKDEIVELIQRAAAQTPEAAGCSKDDILATVETFFEKTPPCWNLDELTRFMKSVRAFVDEFPNEALANILVDEVTKGLSPRGPLATPCRRLETDLRELLDRSKDQLSKHPHALAGLLGYLRQRIQRDASLRPPAKVEHLDDFEKWLDAGRLSNALLGLPLLRRVRLRKLQKHVAQALIKRFEEQGQELITKIIFLYATERLDRARKEALAQWKNLSDLQKDVVREVDQKIRLDDRRVHQRASLGFGDVDVAAVLQAELKRLGDDAAEGEMKKALLNAFQSAANLYKDGKGKPGELLQAMNEAMDKLRADSGGTTFEYLSPDVAYGREAVDCTLLTCVTPVFRSGRIDALISQRTARLVIPTGFRDHAVFEQRMKDACRGLLGAGVQQISSQDGDRMVVLVESLFHPADDIAHVDSYWNDYRRRSNQDLFHIDKRLTSKMTQLLASGRTGEVLCGNVGCLRDIRSVSREEWICPFCARPIRNRCGNGKCGLDDLSELPDLESIIRKNTCPGCHERLLTYWWECPRHKQRIPMDKPHCPHCVREGRTAEKRPQSVDRFVCPACRERYVVEPYVATGNIAKACRFGVNGHEEQRALRDLQELPHSKDCPKCGTHLVPYCPLTAEAEEAKPHFLHRRTEHDRWRCITHPDQFFYTCFQCSFAVMADDAYCGRCGVALTDCRYCTKWRAIRIPDIEAQEHCPSCGIPRREPPLRGPLDLFCTNIFICPAAAALDSAVLPRDTSRCPFCPTPSHPLFPQYLREDTVNACPLCRLVFTATRFPKKDAPPPAGSCPLCGLLYADAARLSTDRGNLAATLAIVRALVFFREDDDTLRAIHRGLIPERRRFIPSLLHEFVGRIQSPHIKRAIAPRIERLIDAFRQFTTAEGEDPKPTPPPAETSNEKTDEPRPKTFSDLTDPMYLLTLTDDQIEDWVQKIDLDTTIEMLEAWLGAGLAHIDAGNPEQLQRYQSMCKKVREYFAKKPSPG